MRGSARVIVMGNTDWFTKAACRGLGAEMFYPDGDSDDYSLSSGARLVCGECPVQLECLKWAIDNGEYDYGIWGGVGSGQRRPAVAEKTIAKIEAQIERKRILQLDGENRRRAFAKLKKKSSS